jgi:hypothetical protein
LPGLFTLKNAAGKIVPWKKDAGNVIEFATQKGMEYLFFIKP